MKLFFCYLLFPLLFACKKQSDVTVSQLPEPEASVIANAYPVVTAASSLYPDTAREYRLGLAPYASFFSFNRSILNGDLYYKAIQESIKKFKPFKFYIANDGTGRVVTIVMPSSTEVAEFEKEWER